jgi:hypothetical protein
MAAISSLFRRLGFVRLDDYGLILTPEGRVLSTRPAVLDDGLGGKIVGWREGDLAAMELEHWEPSGRRAPASPRALPPRPPVVARTIAPAAPVAPAPTPIAATNVPAPVALPGLVPVAPAPAVEARVAPAPVVAAEPVAEDDEWEWEIAMARARAAAEWAEEAAAVASNPATVIQTGDWPKTEPLHECWETPPPRRIEMQPALAVGSAPVARTTVIPVPSLPRVSDPHLVRPVVSPRRPIVPIVPPRRMPKATGRVDDTIRTHAAPANDDRTSPGIALPPASSGKRVAAKHR